MRRFISRRGTVRLVMVGLATMLCSARSASAAAITGVQQPYLQTSNSPLVTASPGFRLENFETGSPSLTTLGINLTSLHGSQIDLGTSVDGDDGSVDGSGAAGHSLTVFTQAGTSGATFAFNNVTIGAYPKSAALAVTAAACSPLVFTVYDTSNAISGTYTIPSVSTSTPTGDDFLFWASDSAGIGAISVSSNNAATHLHLDHVQYDTINAIPEPGTSALTLALLGLLAARRRHRASEAR